MPNYYKVNKDGMTSSNESDSNVVIISEAKDEREDIEAEFIEEYQMPDDIFKLIEYAVLAPRYEKVDNEYLGETLVMVLTNLKDPGNEDTNAEERLDAVSFVLSNEKLFIFIYEDSTIIEDLLDNHADDVASLEDVVLNMAEEIYYSYIYELETIKERIDELNKEAEDATTEKQLLKSLTDTERDLVAIQQTLDKVGGVVKPLLDNENFTNNISQKQLLYNIKWLDTQTKDFVNVNRDLLEALSGHFTTIMSRNLNSLMKFLNSLSLILSMASLILAVWGMSAGGLPFEQSNYGFYIVLVIAAVAAIGMAYYLRKKDYF